MSIDLQAPRHKLKISTSQLWVLVSEYSCGLPLFIRLIFQFYSEDDLAFFSHYLGGLNLIIIGFLYEVTLDIRFLPSFRSKAS